MFVYVPEVHIAQEEYACFQKYEGIGWVRIWAKKIQDKYCASQEGDLNGIGYNY